MMDSNSDAISRLVDERPAAPLDPHDRRIIAHTLALEDDCRRLSDRLWDLAETAYDEYESVERQIELLQVHCFDVTRELGGLPTAFMAEAGAGGPVIAFLGEYDALPNLSQQAGVWQTCAACPGGSGHGCGHNLLGAAAVLAAAAVRRWLAETGRPGRVRYYGCPAEEGGAGKTFRRAARRPRPAAAGARRVRSRGSARSLCLPDPGRGRGAAEAAPCLARRFRGRRAMSGGELRARFRFTGRAAHAAASPHLGRSALDAVELTNVGASFLRGHLPAGVSIEYAVTDAGGSAPNVVQKDAEVLYVLRANDIDTAGALFEGVKDVARGAARMTETELVIERDRPCPDEKWDTVFT